MGQYVESRAVTQECWHGSKEETKGAVGIKLKKRTDLPMGISRAPTPEDPCIRPESSICVIREIGLNKFTGLILYV